ncbi:hypothetical protein [Nonomuraea sediminis]|uniref:hypothetical protein n=1 Tax=Nonomuraea sediminis TaxID=2835864 RepID=UPI001BDCE552|nr:hypothetical protein [Nonomuraea sediminis]
MKRPLALVLSLAVHLLTLAFVLTGGWLVAAHASSFLAWLAGGFLVAIGWFVRPRLGRLPADAEVLDRSSAAELYGTAGRVAERIGVRGPARIAVRDLATDARYERMGLLRTPTLVIGLPLWLALTPKQRVTLLAKAFADVPTAEERTVETALGTLGEWREGLLGAGPMTVREEAQVKIAEASLGIAASPGGYEATSFLGRIAGRVLGAPVIAVEFALRRLARAGESRTEARRRARALRLVSERELDELDRLMATGGYLAPIQAAALRGESVQQIRQGALERSSVLTAGGDGELLALAESDRIDDELLKHYTRAIRGFGLIS